MKATSDSLSYLSGYQFAKNNRMRFAKICIVSRCALALKLVIALAASAAFCANIDQSFFNLRPRLGHFQNVEGYLKIYEEYSANVIKLTDKSLTQIDVNDWRNVRPTGELCVNFLQAFQVKSYKLHKPFDIIPLDACLDWLFDNSDEKKTDLDKFNSVTKDEHNRLSTDAKLKNLFDSTGFKGDKIPTELKEKLHDYFRKLVAIHAENPKNGCHSLWLEAYNDFIEGVYLDKCDDDNGVENCVPFGLEGSDEDSYLNLIVDSTKQAAFNCYRHVTAKQMAGLISAAYEQESKSGLYSMIKTVATGRAAKQSESMHWSREMINILQLVTGSDPERPIQLPLVVQDLNKLKNNDPDTVEKFTEAISQYANANVKLKDTGDDPDGRASFGRAMTKLCRPYIDPKLFLSQTGGSTLWEDDPNAVKRPFEFYNLIYSLVRLTNYPSIFGITKEKFEEDVLANHWEPLYLATFSCQIISTTWGQLDYDTNQDVYKVYLRPNFEVTIEDWPIAVLYNRLGSQKIEVEEETTTTTPTPTPIPSSGGMRSFLPKIPKRIVQVIPEVPPQPAPLPKKRVPLPRKPDLPPKRVVDYKPEPQNQPPADNNVPPSAPLKFKNPLKKGVKTSITPSEDYEPPTISGGMVPDDYYNDDESLTDPLVPMASSSKHKMSTESARMFKELHGRYPQGYVPPSVPSSMKNPYDDLEELTSNAISNSVETHIPVAFDFDRSFVPGGSKFSNPVATQVKTDQWSGINAMSF